MFINDVSAIHNTGIKTDDGKIIWNVCVEEEDGEESLEMTLETMLKLKKEVDSLFEGLAKSGVLYSEIS